MSTKKVSADAKYHCGACGVDASTVAMESADVQGHQVIRCVDPVACRMRAQKVGSWAAA